MKRGALRSLLVSTVLLLSRSGWPTAAATAAEAATPNFILIVCDNLGYGDIEPFGLDHGFGHTNPMRERGI